MELKEVSVNELAAIEHCLWLRLQLPLSQVALNESAEILGLRIDQLIPTTISLLELNELGLGQASRGMVNVKIARTSMFDKFGDLFLPNNDDLLVQWTSVDGARYSNGERLPAVNYGKHPANDQRFLTDEAVHCIRHIVFRFKIAITKFPALWNSFSVLFLRRPLSLEEFSSIAILPFRFYRLMIIDQHFFKCQFQAEIASTTSCGFPLSWYSLSDDSEHHGRKRHVLLITATKGRSEEFLNPCFRFVTASEAVSGDSEGNSKLNVDKLIGYLPIATLAHYGGNVTDNANSAIDESRKTFNGTIKHLEDSAENEEERIKLTTRFGVPRRSIELGDPFHIDNLIVTLESIAAFGDTERGNHRQSHHRQLIQSIHDVHKKVKTLSQKVMDRVLEGTGKTIRIHTTRERQQRWLVNSRSCERILHAMATKTVDDKPALLVWAHEMSQHHTGNWRLAAKDVVEMISMPNIMVGVHFEADLGQYFEVTMKWHGYPGELSTQPGFRVMELHQLYFDYIAP